MERERKAIPVTSGEPLDADVPGFDNIPIALAYMNSENGVFVTCI